jgi:hypothetical protein
MDCAVESETLIIPCTPLRLRLSMTSLAKKMAAIVAENVAEAEEEHRKPLHRMLLHKNLLRPVFLNGFSRLQKSLCLVRVTKLGEFSAIYSL